MFQVNGKPLYHVKGFDIDVVEVLLLYTLDSVCWRRGGLYFQTPSYYFVHPKNVESVGDILPVSIL